MKTLHIPRPLRSAAAIVLALALASCVGAPQPQGTELPGGPYSLSDPLPLAPELTRRTLSNGLTYYVRANGNPGGRIVMYLVVAGGSSVEEAGESGYAHFVEHMAFNGTASFPENELVSYLRSIGMEFGAEVNAYTAHEETLYALEMPTDDPAHFQTGLRVLREWAMDISFDPVEVEKEKGVILEERRLGLGPDELARNRELPVMLAGTRHADRDPIGTEASIRGATAAGLKAFYERTYRPERMAIIVVGDLDPAAASMAIEREFSFPSRDGKKQPRPFFPVAPSADMSFVSTFHPDFEQSIIFYEKIVPYVPEKVIGDYVELLKIRIAAEAIKLRLSDVSRAGDKAWQEAYFDDDYFYGGTRLYAFTLSSEPGRELDAFSDLAMEVERLRRHGFTESEFMRTVDAWRKWLGTLDIEDQDLRSGSFADEYVRNFMYGEPVPGVVNERVYIADTLDSITPEELAEAARLILGADEGFVALRAKTGPGNALLDAQAFGTELERARASELDPILASTDDSSLFDDLPEPGTVVSETRQANGVTELLLSNGARVLLKPTSYDRDAISFVAWSRGGYSSLPVEDHYAAIFAPSLLAGSGLGGLDATRLDELTASLDAGVGWTIGENAEYLYGETATDSLETFLRLVYLNAAEQGGDGRAFTVLRDRLAEQIVPYVQEPGYRFETAWSSHLFGGNPRTLPFEAAGVRALDFGKVRALVNGLFADASDFTYILVGDFNLEQAKSLVATYIGAIPAGEKSEPEWQSPLRPAAAGGVRTDYRLAKEDRATVRMIWSAEAEWSWERESTLSLMAQAFNNRLLDAIREDLGGTYVVSVEGTFTRDPVQQYAVVVSFDCDPARVDELVAEVRAEAASLAAGMLDGRYVDQIKALAQREYDGRLRTNDLWVNRLANAVAYGLDFEIPARMRQAIALADADGFASLAAETLLPEREFVYVMLPAK